MATKKIREPGIAPATGRSKKPSASDATRRGGAAKPDVTIKPVGQPVPVPKRPQRETK